MTASGPAPATSGQRETCECSSRYVHDHGCKKFAAAVSGGQPTDSGGLREEIRDLLAGWQVGSGYYATSVLVDDAAEMADALLSGPLAPLLAADEAVQRVRHLAESWTRYPQSSEDRERNRYGAALEDCGKVLRLTLGVSR